MSGDRYSTNAFHWWRRCTKTRPWLESVNGSIKKNGLRNAALLGLWGQVRENTMHGSAREIKPDTGHMSRRQPERCLHGEREKGGTGEYGMMPPQFRTSSGLRSFLYYGDEQWTSRATSIPDAEVPSRRNLT